ncbi:MAG: sigma-70 family RNA polymerase sigma factor [Eubacteriales bacterium]|nr:sigma-70 family RNA polymerase sigma factor [Eubacteriales bacterium]
MNSLEFTFEQSPWEKFILSKTMGDTIPAAQVLAMMEGEEALEDALQDLETGYMNLSLEGLPRGVAGGEAALRLKQEMALAKKGLRPEDLSPNDPLRLYLEELARTPAWGDEAALAQRCEAGDEKAMEQLTNLGLSRVVELAAEHVGYGVLLLDLIQEGSLGLWQAVRSCHGDFAAHRDHWIRFYMARAITLQARNNGVGQKLRAALEDYRAVDERLLSELGRNPTIEEIALELHMNVEEAQVVQKMLENARLLASAAPAPAEEPPEEEDRAVEDTALFQMRQRISDLLSGLSEEDARLLTLRFGLEGGRPLSPEDTGRRLGLTPDEVVARESAALASLRNVN